MTMARRRVPSSGFRPTQESTPVGQYDWGLIALFLMLLCIGLLMVLSASGVVAERINGDKYFFFKRQLIYAVIGGVVMWVLAAVPRHILYKLQYPFLLFVLMLLFVTLSPLGARVNGAQSWISVKFFSIQPLEFAKIALALYLAYFMSTKQELVKTFSKGIIPPFAMTALFCFLLLAQPDFGGAVVLSLILFFMCLIGGTRFIYLFMAIGVGLAGALALIIFEPYRARRLVAFLDPFADAQNAGYQLVQSLYALGSGGFFGVGMGGSSQKMFYLPEAGYFLWFIWALWLIFLLISMIKTKTGRTVLFAASLLTGFLPVDWPEIFCINKAVAMLKYFMLGVFLINWPRWLDSAKKIPGMIPVCALPVLFACTLLVRNDILTGLMGYILPFAGIHTICVISARIKSLKHITQKLLVVSASSYIIYLFHTTFEGFVKSLVQQVPLLANGNDPLYFSVGAAAVIGAGIFLPIILHRYILQRNRLLRFLFGLKPAK